MADATREENADLSTQCNPEGAMTPPGTPTEWRTPEKAFEGKGTQGTSNTTREENIDQDTRPKPEGATTPLEHSRSGRC